jgi:hypothetical protein
LAEEIVAPGFKGLTVSIIAAPDALPLMPVKFVIVFVPLPGNQTRLGAPIVKVAKVLNLVMETADWAPPANVTTLYAAAALKAMLRRRGRGECYRRAVRVESEVCYGRGIPNSLGGGHNVQVPLPMFRVLVAFQIR